MIKYCDVIVEEKKWLLQEIFHFDSAVINIDNCGEIINGEIYVDEVKLELYILSKNSLCRIDDMKIFIQINDQCQIYYPKNIHDKNIKDIGIVMTYCEYIRYFININEDNYKIENNKIIIFDEFLITTRKKLIKKQLGKHSHLGKYSVEEILKWKDNYLLFFGNGYFIATDQEDRNSEDVLLTPDEFMIKQLIE